MTFDPASASACCERTAAGPNYADPPLPPPPLPPVGPHHVNPALPRPSPEPKMAAGETLPRLGIVPDSKMVVNEDTAEDILSGSVRTLRPGRLGDAPPQPACRSHWRRGGPGLLSLASKVSLPLSPLQGPGNYFPFGGGGPGRGLLRLASCAPSGRRRARAGRRRMLRPLGPPGRR